MVTTNDCGRTRTCNPQIRSLVPYPLGHTAPLGQILMIEWQRSRMWQNVLQDFTFSWQKRPQNKAMGTAVFNMILHLNEARKYLNCQSTIPAGVSRLYYLLDG